MGKSKYRTFEKYKKSYMFDMTRHQAIDFIVNETLTSAESKNLISLFGLKSEELTEAGMAYETVSSLEHCFKLS